MLRDWKISCRRNSTSNASHLRPRRSRNWGAKSFHVICCDYEIPEKEGVRFLQRALGFPEPPCFLMITSAAEMRDKQLDGLSGVILKPYDGEALVDRVSRLCQITETRRRVASARDSMRRHAEDLGDT